MTNTKIENQTFDVERALYGLRDAVVSNCTFDGPDDGESALKESGGIRVENCTFNLRYPLWHVTGLKLSGSTMGETACAALWYDSGGEIANTRLGGIKALRECRSMKLRNCTVDSLEFGWKCDGLTLKDTSIQSEYPFLANTELRLDNVDMTGKYGFQYSRDVEIVNSRLDTKDAFWHGRNVTVRDSVVKGEYLGWYSDGLTLVNCRIEGTQPFCYCTNLTLENCTMADCDLAFEYADVQADVRGSIDSVKNPRSGKIVADEIGEVILEDAVMDCNAQIVCRNEHPSACAAAVA